MRIESGRRYTLYTDEPIWGYLTVFASLAPVQLRRKVEQALEYAEWAMVVRSSPAATAILRTCTSARTALCVRR